MALDQILIWIRKQLNREPESADLYEIGKSLYQAGMFQGAAKVLQAYCDRQGAELPGFHLLGYAYAQIGECDASVRALRKVVNCGFDADWQLLVQMRIDADRLEEEREKERIRAMYFEPIQKEHEKLQLNSMEKLQAGLYSVDGQPSGVYVPGDVESDAELSDTGSTTSRTGRGRETGEGRARSRPPTATVTSSDAPLALVTQSQQASLPALPEHSKASRAGPVLPTLSSTSAQPLPSPPTPNSIPSAGRIGPVHQLDPLPKSARGEPSSASTRREPIESGKKGSSPEASTPLLAPVIGQQDILPTAHKFTKQVPTAAAPKTLKTSTSSPALMPGTPSSLAGTSTSVLPLSATQQLPQSSRIPGRTQPSPNPSIVPTPRAVVGATSKPPTPLTASTATPTALPRPAPTATLPPSVLTNVRRRLQMTGSNPSGEGELPQTKGHEDGDYD